MLSSPHTPLIPPAPSFLDANSSDDANNQISCIKLAQSGKIPLPDTPYNPSYLFGDDFEEEEWISDEKKFLRMRSLNQLYLSKKGF